MDKIILEAGTYKYEFDFSKSSPLCKILNSVQLPLKSTSETLFRIMQ